MTMEKKYEIIIYWSSEDNAFVAEVPELSGCMADGKTYQVALSNAEQITDSLQKQIKAQIFIFGITQIT